MERIFCKDASDQGYPMVELDSDSDGDNNSTSSEDEIDAMLNGSFQKKKNQRQKGLDEDLSSDDDFDKEMDAELNQRMTFIENTHKGITKTLSNEKKKKECDQKRYEDEFLDSIDKSDDEEESTKGELSTQQEKSNDDLLYDPEMDEEDQKWVDKQKKNCIPEGSDRSLKASKNKQGSSDSALSCPACMTFLSRDCQRHSLYKNQFRAMFVTNCTIDNTERLKYPIQEKSKKNKKNKKQKVGNSNSEEIASTSNVSISNTSDDLDNVEDLYNPVKCSVCTTEVGVFDKDEVYHFFNVIESNG